MCTNDKIKCIGLLHDSRKTSLTYYFCGWFPCTVSWLGVNSDHQWICLQRKMENIWYRNNKLHYRLFFNTGTNISRMHIWLSYRYTCSIFHSLRSIKTIFNWFKHGQGMWESCQWLGAMRWFLVGYTGTLSHYTTGQLQIILNIDSEGLRVVGTCLCIKM